jgi:hypothetical protein
MRLLACAVVALAAVLAAPAHADPGPGPGMCQFLGAHYNVWYECDQYQPWLPYGTADNPPYGSPLPASECAPPMQHNEGCS